MLLKITLDEKFVHTKICPVITKNVMASFGLHTHLGKCGSPLADVPGAAISPPWDFPPKALVLFFRVLGKGERRAEACSGADERGA